MPLKHVRAVGDLVVSSCKSAFSVGATYEEQPVGKNWRSDAIAGYFLELSAKTNSPLARNLPDLQPASLAQIALGWWERRLEGESEADERFDEICDLLRRQASVDDNGQAIWHYSVPLAKYGLSAGWASAMAQGQIASVLCRSFVLTGDHADADLARAAAAPLYAPSNLVTVVREGVILEEAPSDPPSHILNGWIYALWGLRDVAVALGDSAAWDAWSDGVSTLRRMLPRYDTGWWSRYSLFPHRLTDLAKPFYHRLHVAQLQATAAACADESLLEWAERWARYDSRQHVTAAVAHKAAFAVARRMAT